MVLQYIVDCYRSLEFLNDQHQGEDRVRLGRSYPDNSDEDNESTEVVIYALYSGSLTFFPLFCPCKYF